MSRLRYSPNGALRALQISNAQLFIFVEGGLDRAFADKIVHKRPSSYRHLYQVRSVKEYSGTGGKPELLRLFKKLRRQSLLKGRSFGKPHYSLFLLDKDVDDLTRRLIASDHLIYTKNYDLEATLFLCGDPVSALADACHVTKSQASSLLGDHQEFAAQVACLWSEWVALCIVSARLKTNCGCTYDRVSTINCPPLSETDMAALAAIKTSLADRTGMSVEQIERRYITAHQHHLSAISTHNPFRFFKGKWLGHILDAHLQSKPRIPDSNLNGVFEKLIIALIGQITETSAESFSPELIARLGQAEEYAAAA